MRGGDLGGYVDEVTLKDAAVPVLEHTGNLCRLHRETVAHDAVDLGDHLHVGVFDAVVDGLDEVPGPRLAHMVGARRTIICPCGDGLQDRGHAGPILGCPTCHDRWAVPRALLPTRDADAHVAERQARRRPTVGVMEVGVASVDHQIIGLKKRGKGGKLVIDRLTGRNHQDDRPGRGHGGHQIGECVGGYDPVGQRPCLGVEGVSDRGRSVPDGDRKALFGNVQGQRRAHGAKADQADVRLYGHCTPLRFRTTE